MKNKTVKMSALLLAGSMIMVLTACQSGEGSDNSLPVPPPSIDIGSGDISTPGPTIKIASVEKKASFKKFDVNKAEKPSNKRTEFFDRSKNYMVGTDNKFNVKPIVGFVDENYDDIEVKDWTYQIALAIKNDETYTAVADNNEYLDSINLETCDIDFKETAIGKTFKVTITPDGLSSTQVDKPQYQSSMIFDVVEGYNLYKAEELAYFDNQTEAKGAHWTAFKTDRNLSLTLQPETFIFHDDVKVTKNDLPKEFFYNEGDSDLSTSDPDYQRTLGSLRDDKYIYIHEFDNTATHLQVLGNYFTLDAAELPVITREWGKITPEGKATSHSSLFRTQTGGVDLDADNTFTMSELNLVGNAPKVEETLKAGGIILHKTDRVKTLFTNVISRCWFITFFCSQGSAAYDIVKVKAYDSFNSFIYNYGGENVSIADSEMIGAGGPVIIQDHTDPRTDNESVGKTIVNNSKLESYVAGTEGWFDLYGASALVPTVKGMNALFTPFGKSFLKTDSASEATLFNLICVNKSGNSQGLTSETIRGKLVIDDNPAFDFGTYDENSDPLLAGFISQVNTATGGASPVFQSCGQSGYAFTNGSALIGGDMQPITSNQHSVFTGDYLGFYYNGMCFTMGYFAK